MERYEDPEQLIDELFDEFDMNGNGFITFEEYQEAAARDPNILQALKLF